MSNTPWPLDLGVDSSHDLVVNVLGDQVREDLFFSASPGPISPDSRGPSSSADSFIKGVLMDWIFVLVAIGKSASVLEDFNPLLSLSQKVNKICNTFGQLQVAARNQKKIPLKLSKCIHIYLFIVFDVDVERLSSGVIEFNGSLWIFLWLWKVFEVHSHLFSQSFQSVEGGVIGIRVHRVSFETEGFSRLWFFFLGIFLSFIIINHPIVSDDEVSFVELFLKESSFFFNVSNLVIFCGFLKRR
jgi:hypothetical protein